MKELEAKFIFTGSLNDLKGFERKEVKQAYLLLEGKQHLRVRIVEADDWEAGYMTFKQFITDNERNEYEYEIPMKDANELYHSTDCRVEKTRYSKTFDRTDISWFTKLKNQLSGKTNEHKFILDVDVYYDGRISVDVEYFGSFPASDLSGEQFDGFLGEEIKGELAWQWSNIGMARARDEHMKAMRA